jgi:hypothetical protein
LIGALTRPFVLEFRRVGGLVAIGAVLAGGAYVGANHFVDLGPFAPPVASDPGDANLWVDTDGGTCTRQSPAGAYVDAQACGTFDAAYDAASGGDTVRVKAGTYASQTITGSKASTVVFRPAESESVTVNGLTVGDHTVTSARSVFNLEVRDMTIPSWLTEWNVDSFTARDLDIGHFYIAGSKNISILGGDIGPEFGNGADTDLSFVTYGRCENLGDCTGSVNQVKVPEDIYMEEMYVHDYKRGHEDDHMECFFIQGVDGLTIRNSRFVRCDIYDVFFTSGDAAGQPDQAIDVLIENNFFDRGTVDGLYQCCTQASVFFHDAITTQTNITIRYNSAKQGFSAPSGPTKTNFVVKGNLSAWAGCDSGVTYSYNVWGHDGAGAACSGTDDVVLGDSFGYDQLQFADPDGSAVDLHLSGSAFEADGHGDPSSKPADDIDGDSRASTPDAGADER